MRNTTGETPVNSRPGTSATSIMSISSPTFRVIQASPSASHQEIFETPPPTTTNAMTFHSPANEPNVPQSSSSSQVGALFLPSLPTPALTTHQAPPNEGIQLPGLERTSMNTLSAMQTTPSPKVSSVLGRRTPKSAKKKLFRTNGVASVSDQS